MATAPGSLPAVTTNPRWLGCRCTLCGRDYAPGYEGFVCSACGIDGILDARYDYEAIAAVYDPDRRGPGTAGIWRFADLLPVRPAADHPALRTTSTGLHPAPRLARHLGLDHLVLKDDTLNPSGSLKDRAAVVAVARAGQLGLDHIACASTGNAAASLAVFTARAGMSCTIFVPAAAPRAKLAQLLIHGARIIRVDGTYDQAFDLSLKEIERNRWYSRNCAHNPLLVEGKKTAALELVHELLGAGTDPDPLPDAVFVPVGDGCIVSSVAKAFWELKEIGRIPRLPRVIGVQAAGAAPLAHAWAECRTDPQTLGGPQVLAAVKRITPRTRADSICVGIPRNRLKAWRYVAACRGSFLAVEDEAIIEAIELLAARAGVFAEPSGAAGLAGVVAALERGLIRRGERVAVMVTGNGLKDVEAGLGRVTIPEPVSPPG